MFKFKDNIIQNAEHQVIPIKCLHSLLAFENENISFYWVSKIRST